MFDGMWVKEKPYLLLMGLQVAAATTKSNVENPQKSKSCASRCQTSLLHPLLRHYMCLEFV